MDSRREYPVLPQVAVGAFILAETGEGSQSPCLLLVKRKNPPDAGLWAVPGGRIKLGETLETAVVREVKEETNLDIIVGKLAGITEKIVPDDKQRVRYHYIIIDYWARLAHGCTPDQLSFLTDAEDAAWSPLDRISQFSLSPTLVELLKDLKIPSP